MVAREPINSQQAEVEAWNIINHAVETVAEEIQQSLIDNNVPYSIHAIIRIHFDNLYRHNNDPTVHNSRYHVLQLHWWVMKSDQKNK